MKKKVLILFSICLVAACQRAISEDTSGKVQESIDKIKIKIQETLGDKTPKQE